MVVALDLLLCTFAALLAFSLRIGEWYVFVPEVLILVVATCVIWIVVASFQGVYRSMLRFSGAKAIKDLAASCAIMAVILTVLSVLVGVNIHIPRTTSLLVPLILFMLTASSRAMLSTLLRETLYSRRRDGRRHVLVYGAGVAGRELTVSIKYHPEFQVVGFMDDNPLLAGRRLEEHKIWHSAELKEVLSRHSVNEVLLAMPGASRARRRAIIDEIRELAPDVGVRSLPDFSEIASGRVSVNDLREVQIEELLGRDQVTPDPLLMSAKIAGRCVMVTGAGGSIGSELVRQIVQQGPSKIVLAERSEFALYLIESEIRELCKRRNVSTKIVPKLVDVTDERDLEQVFKDLRPETVFHAAAYKHVPLVESDPMSGIRNNVVATYNCCVLAERFGVKDFTLISSDKAVRPSSVMGASKRVCELVVQSRAKSSKGPTFSAVRFGNVLGSSGSVVPLFRRQIAAGGPVTVTHRDATRYFMTISEAAQLVVQAGAMARSGDIFLLDMGEPVRIYDLAKMMIQLSGLAVIGEGGRDGDVEIREIGLRPGEKLHEELLIDSQSLPTVHPRIVKASESGVAHDQFDRHFRELLTFIEKRDAKGALAAVAALVAMPSGRQSVPRPRPQKALEDKKAETYSSKPKRVAPIVTNRRALES